MSAILDADQTKARELFDVNVFAPVNMIQAFSRLLVATQGTIVNIGSYVDALPVPWQGIYNASKAALRSITDNLRLELRPFEVKVVYVRPQNLLPSLKFRLLTIFIDRGGRNSKQFP